ncbi:MAG: FtsW/RodA/SpoVE family cell cycle protein [Paracoccaceae bacterium]
MTEIAFRAQAPVRSETASVEDWWRSVDRWSLGAIFALAVAGLVLGLAASPPLAEKNGLWTYHYVIRQVVFSGLALAIAVALSMASPVSVRRIGVLLFLASAVAVALLPAFGTDFGKGAVRWFSLGFASVQPSEFLKPGFVLMAAWLMAGAKETDGPPGRVLSGLLAVTLAAMLAMQPDYGQAALLVAVWSAMLFVSGAPIWLLPGLGLAIGLAGTAAYLNSSHFASRIDGYLQGAVDPRTQLAYAESAIREGGLFGVGAAAGSVKWTLPDAHTDFIIAVAAEEFGLLLTLVIIGLFLFITIRALGRLLAIEDPFLRLGGTGLAVLFGLQAFVNFSVAIRLLPAKGMTLPFVSYGGSSVIASALALGALLALTRSRPANPGALLRRRL